MSTSSPIEPHIRTRRWPIILGVIVGLAVAVTLVVTYSAYHKAQHAQQSAEAEKAQAAQDRSRAAQDRANAASGLATQAALQTRINGRLIRILRHTVREACHREAAVVVGVRAVGRRLTHGRARRRFVHFARRYLRRPRCSHLKLRLPQAKRRQKRPRAPALRPLVPSQSAPPLTIVPPRRSASRIGSAGRQSRISPVVPPPAIQPPPPPPARVDHGGPGQGNRPPGQAKR